MYMFEESKLIQPGDLVYLPTQEVYNQRISGCYGIAVAEDKIFTGETFLDMFRYEKVMRLTPEKVAMRQKLQEMYMRLNHLNVLYQNSKMSPGDLFVSNLTEYVYLGCYKDRHIFLALHIFGSLSLYRDKHEEVHRLLHTGNLCEEQLWQFINSKYRSFADVLRSHPDGYTYKLIYIGHIEISISNRIKEYLANINWFF